MIRPACLADLDRLVMMGADFTATVGLFVYDDAAAARYLTSLIESDKATVLVPDDLSGMIGGAIDAPAFAPMFLSARELFWWSEGDHGIELLRAFELWAVKQGAGNVFLSLALLGNDDRVAKALEHSGYNLVEKTYLRVI